MLEHLLSDLRYAIRTLAKRPILLITTTISIVWENTPTKSPR